MIEGVGVEVLNNYVKFAKICQDNATPTMGHACYTITGHSRPWSEQNDGPGIQSIAMMQAYSQLDDGVAGHRQGSHRQEHRLPARRLQGSD